jgi:hypothetical protein
MVLPSVFLIHSATLHQQQQNFTLGYDAGTAAFTAGKTLTGATSHATAIIVSTGAVASGTLTLHTITGTFQNDEAISDNGTVPGAAVVNGTIAEAFDAYGNLSYTDVTATVACRFVGPQESFRSGARNIPYIVSTPRVLLPAGTAVAEGDTLTSTILGFAGTFRVNSVKQTYEAAQATVSHITCEIAAAGATGGA